MSNITDLLNRRASDVEKPKPLPTGTYIVRFADPGKQTPVKTKDGDVETMEFMLTPVSPQDDVDAAVLAAQGGIGNRRLRHTLWLREEDLWKIKDLGEKLGMTQDEMDEMSLAQIVANYQNKMCYAKVKHVPSKDGSEIYANIENLWKM